MTLSLNTVTDIQDLANINKEEKEDQNKYKLTKITNNFYYKVIVKLTVALPMWGGALGTCQFLDPIAALQKVSWQNECE